ncbi:MAG: hypothetical protein LC676_09485 [Loktanella sp.]|nr:hypothetical protein [Loktanella sp.]
MRRNKDVCLGEDDNTNRKDHAPRIVVTLVTAARTLLKRISTLPTKVIEIIENDRNHVLRIWMTGSRPAFPQITLCYIASSTVEKMT